MYAIVETGGKQRRVAAGDIIKVEKIESGEKEISLDKVLLVSKDETVHVGKPYLAGASVKAEVQGDVKADKVLIFKKKPRKVHKKLRGHRQGYTELKITDIVFGG